jgi:hypothetical protein
LSLQKLLTDQATAKFKNDECAIIRGGIKIMKANLENDNLYYLSSHTPILNDNKLLVSRYTKDISYWHRLLGHFHPRAIVDMAKNNMIEGLPSSISMDEWKGCTECTEAKSTKWKRKRHPLHEKPSKLPSMPGDTWHSDQKGPITPQSIHGSRYTILFIDDHTGYVEASHLRSLDETIDAYNSHKARVTTLFNRNIKMIICDGHSTYAKLRTHIEKDGTSMQMRAPYDPNGNALAERTIRTIFEMARVILNGSGFPQNRWEEAVDHAVWIRNRCKSGRLQGKTPFQAYWKIKPDLNHLHPFGCLAYALIPHDIRTRVFNRITTRCAFMGFSKQHDAFSLLDLETRKTITSRDVVFFDNSFPLSTDQFSRDEKDEQEAKIQTDNYIPNISKTSLRSYNPNMESKPLFLSPDWRRFARARTL